MRDWLRTGMFKNEADRDERARRVAEYLGDHNQFKSHGARVGVRELQDRGVPVVVINDNPALHDAVMSVHHAISLTFDGTGAYKIFENSRGNALLRLIQVQVVQVAPGQAQQPPRLQPQPQPSSPPAPP